MRKYICVVRELMNLISARCIGSLGGIFIVIGYHYSILKWTCFFYFGHRKLFRTREDLSYHGVINILVEILQRIPRISL